MSSDNDSKAGAPNEVSRFDALGVFDNPRYARIAFERAQDYQSAAPFPHIVLDDFLPIPLAQALSAAFPRADAIDWVERDNENNPRRYQHDETRLPGLLRGMLRELNSRRFNPPAISSTGEHSNHGQRLPNRCPPGVYRKVLNLYQHTSTHTDGDVAEPQFTLYKPGASTFAMELGNLYRKTAGDTSAPEVTHG